MRNCRAAQEGNGKAPERFDGDGAYRHVFGNADGQPLVFIVPATSVFPQNFVQLLRRIDGKRRNHEERKTRRESDTEHLLL